MVLAAILLTRPRPRTGGDDAWRKRNRKQRREYINKLARHDELRRDQWQARVRIDKQIRDELREAYAALSGMPKHAAAVEAIVAPYRDNRNASEPINWQWMINRVEAVQQLLPVYYDVLDEEALLLLL